MLMGAHRKSLQLIKHGQIEFWTHEKLMSNITLNIEK